VSPRRHLLTAGAVWVVLSILGIVVVAGLQIIPVIASREAAIENQAFVLLTAVSVPVLMLVVVGLVYAALRFRAPGGTVGGSSGGMADVIVDGPPIHSHRATVQPGTPSARAARTARPTAAGIALVRK